MTQNVNSMDGYVKKQTMLMVTLVAFVAGFLGGAAFAVYKTPAQLPVQKMGAMPQPHNHAPMSEEHAAKILELEKITKQNPDDAQAWAHLGNAYFDSENPEKAIAAYTKSLTIKPNDPNIITDMGVMYRKVGKFDEAMKTFDRAIQIDPSAVAARFNKGIVLMHDLNDADSAIKEWEELVKINPNAATPSGQPVAALIAKMKPNK